MKISVKAHPKSKQVKVVMLDSTHYEVWVRQAPDKGQANKGVIDALCDFLDFPRSRIRVFSGAASRQKIIEIEDS